MQFVEQTDIAAWRALSAALAAFREEAPALADEPIVIMRVEGPDGASLGWDALPHNGQPASIASAADVLRGQAAREYEGPEQTGENIAVRLGVTDRTGRLIGVVPRAETVAASLAAAEPSALVPFGLDEAEKLPASARQALEADRESLWRAAQRIARAADVDQTFADCAPNSAVACQEMAPAVEDALRNITMLRIQGARDGIDIDAAIREIGGLPDLSTYNAQRQVPLLGSQAQAEVDTHADIAPVA